MALRFRLYHVANDDATLREQILFEIPECTVNVPTSSRIDESNNITTFEALSNWMVSHSNGTVRDMTNMLLWNNSDNNSHTILLKNKGFRTVWDSFNNARVGDKIYINRWDHSHSYMLLKSISAYQMVFDYMCPDGTIAYSNVAWFNPQTFGNYGYQYSIPWLMYWGEGSNNYHLCDIILGIYDTYNAFLDWTIRDAASPTSIDNAESFWDNAEIIDSDNPYAGGGYSIHGGGNPNKQSWGENSDFPSADALPDESEYSAVACDLITIFSPTASQLRTLASLLWQKGFFDFVDQLVTNIQDLFISFAMVPFTITGGSNATISWFDFNITGTAAITSVTLKKAPKQFYEFNMGNISLTGSDDRMFASDSVLDYSPYSKLGIYLPFIGYQELDIDECREKTINLKYRIDILSGACVALISINGRTMYQFSGNCLCQLPLTGQDFSQIVSNAVNVGIAAASAGTTGAIASAGDALTASRVAGGQISPEMGEYQNAQHAAQVSNAENSLAGATANGFMGMKPNYKKTGAISGTTSLMSIKQPYLCLTTPRQSMPEGYEKVCGFPCNEGGTLGSFTGFTVVEDIRLNGLVATSPEVEEIYKLLKTGVII